MFNITHTITILVGVPGFEPGVACSQNRNVSRYTTLRYNDYTNTMIEKTKENRIYLCNKYK